MYIPSAFSVADSDAMHALMRAFPLATLVRYTPQGLVADAVPLWLDAEAGVLQGHVARSNPLSQEGISEALAIFHGPQAYVSPSFLASKQVDGKVVPTWNYMEVQVKGRLRLIDDESWLLRQMASLTHAQEAALAQPWTLEDAPAGFIRKLSAAVIGIELEIGQLEGKFKLSQNQSAENRASIRAALAQSPLPQAPAVARVMSDDEFEAE
ncbi:FMN-binding negative transcriptional regulator [Craterilacuibacter sinensis]|uniref:FMN-binding negative transcriptional regulator n=1 Tax=Craterilacuibacter sinensis TaxID=2686017 RepID=A0A845BJG4_9NEIS|nr:FMN-binding negative transcriptional regulator [Craterilacuibacter sinensis]MXR35408.1 FMN-binding negative transcriptional regulator [Craterilacuibacter sinensis]